MSSETVTRSRYEGKKILVNPKGFNNDPDEIAGGILFETFNAITHKEFTKIFGEAKAGDLSRVDFIVGIEKLEYDNAVLCHEKVQEIRKADGWGAKADRFEKYDKTKGKTFADYYIEQVIASVVAQKVDAAMVYGQVWGDDSIAGPWATKHGKTTYDDPSPATKRTFDNKEYIDLTQKALAIYVGNPYEKK